MEDEAILWQSESNSMLSSMVGRVMNTLLSSRPRKLEDAIVKLGEAPKSTSAATLEESLRILNKYVRDVVDEEQTLDEVLIPMIENVLRCKDSKHPNQAMILLNWLFQDEALFFPLAKGLASVISRREDHYIALGWCRLVLSLLKYETKMTSFSNNGFRDNYQTLLKILSSSVEHLSVMVKNGSLLQDGFELPTRLSAAAADCILVLTEALTQKLSDPGNPSGKGAHRSNSNKPISILEEKLEEHKNTSAVSSSFDGRLLLWQNLHQLIILVQKLVLWSQKSRPLHAKGLEKVLKWLQQLGSNCTQVEAGPGSQFQVTESLLLSSCWRHYSVLCLLEDSEFYQRYDELIEQYLSGIEFYSEGNMKDHVVNGDRCVETNKFFLNCLALLLGRLDIKRLEITASLHGQRISRALLSQFYCADEDVVDIAASIFRFVIFKIAATGGCLNNPTDSKELLMPLLGLWDEPNGAARAVTVLIADYCSISTDDWCVDEVLRRLASGSISQRRNAADVISELFSISSNTTLVVSSSFWQKITKQLLDCLGDDDSLIRSQAMSLLPLTDPTSVLPALVRIIGAHNGIMKSSASNAFVQVLTRNSERFDVIRTVLNSLSDLYNAIDNQEGTGGIKEDTSNLDLDEVFKLIPEWAKTVQDWNLLVGPLVDKMLSEPTNAIVVRFLSNVNEHLADAADLVLGRLLVNAQKQEEMSGSVHVSVGAKTDDDSDRVKSLLFDRLCPLLVIKMLPLRVFNDFSCMTMYGQTLQQCVANGADKLDVCNCECVASLLFNRAFCHLEYEDVRKLAAELCGRIHPKVLFPVVLAQLQNATESKELVRIKACLFALCTSLVIRGWDSASHPVITKIIKILQAVLLWPSVNGDEVTKAQHGCIDCLALIICAELQAPKTVVGLALEKSYITQNGSSVLSFVISKLTNDEGESGLTDDAQKTYISIPFRLCMANVLISTCQKVSESATKAFAKKTIPRLIYSSQAAQNAEVRAACVQVLFSAATHLKLAIIPYGHDLLKVSVSSLRKESQQERMAGARLLASLMASDDAVIESISGGLLEARLILLHISTSDPSPQLRQICQKLLVCLTSH